MIKRTLAAAAVGGLALLGLAVPSAHASEVNCAPSNNCGTLHGVDALDAPVALDAKRQADLGMDIGFPDLPGDRATAFSLVPHAGHGHDLRAWADSSVSVTPTIRGLTATVTNGVLTFTYTGGVAGYSYSVSLGYLPGVQSSVTLNSAGTGTLTFPEDLRRGVTQVSVSLSATALPGGTDESQPPTLTGTITFNANAIEVYTPSQGVTSYTIVYVTAAGTWTSDCVTAVGAGMLRNEPCTLGRDPSQQFEFDVAGSPVVVSASGQAYSVKNIVTGKFLEDQSTADPSVPQTDAADSVVGSGRQLDVNGPDTAVWSFGS